MRAANDAELPNNQGTTTSYHRKVRAGRILTGRAYFLHELFFKVNSPLGLDGELLGTGH